MMALDTWFNSIMLHAVANRENGWGWFVDGVDIYTFADDVRAYNIREYEDAFELYNTWTMNRPQ